MKKHLFKTLLLASLTFSCSSETKKEDPSPLREVTRTTFEKGEFDWGRMGLEGELKLSDFSGQNIDKTCLKADLQANDKSTHSASFDQFKLTTLYLKGTSNVSIEAREMEIYAEDISGFEGELKCKEGHVCKIVTKTPVELFKGRTNGEFTFHSVPFGSSAAIEAFCENPKCSHYEKLSYIFHKERHNDKEEWIVSDGDILKNASCDECGDPKIYRMKFKDCFYQINGKTKAFSESSGGMLSSTSVKDSDNDGTWEDHRNRLDEPKTRSVPWSRLKIIVSSKNFTWPPEPDRF